MEDAFYYLTDWLNLAVRWIHVFAGIMWVGQTYFFTWLDGRFTRMENRAAVKSADDRVWMVHSGGFYLVDKQKRPVLTPNTLHWFRWEAAATWISGIVLLFLVYYMGGLMVDESMNETTPMIAGACAIILAWPAYDILWRSPICKNEKVGAAVSYLLLVGVIYTLTHLMEGRAAYLHTGAMLGTIMTANVWFRILPSQKKMVASLHAGTEPDLALAERAKTRSKHNTYMAVPVVFMMISNHYPVASYGDSWNWAILSGLVLLGWGAAKIIRRA
ncbi:MAG TPA: urate hydroxylase PuuD [Bacteroidota bacterium]|nr:urate hydroxylase PuuD [Bacteroidota bacterium]